MLGWRRQWARPSQGVSPRASLQRIITSGGGLGSLASRQYQLSADRCEQWLAVARQLLASLQTPGPRLALLRRVAQPQPPLRRLHPAVQPAGGLLHQPRMETGTLLHIVLPS